MNQPDKFKINQKYSIKAFYPNFYTDSLISYVSLRLIKYFNDEQLTADIMGITSDRSVDVFRKIVLSSGDCRTLYYDAIPLVAWKILHRIFPENFLKSISEYRFFGRLKKNDIVYLWPGSSISLYRKVKSIGCTIITEMINTMQSTSKAILDREFLSLDMPITHGITDKAVVHDIQAAKISDFIFSPSPGVTKSIIDAGISPNKIIQTSYGLKKKEIFNDKKTPDEKRPFTFLFVGHICVRKGIHLLLSAWKESCIDAKMRIVGRISEEIRTLFDEYLKQCPSIEHIGFVKDLKPIYESADVFILPSIEEGSPLVTYLALGAGLPVIASSMGAGGIIENGQEGIVIDPHVQSDMIDAMQKLYKDELMRRRMATASKNKAEIFTWERVAKTRKKILLDRIANTV